MDLGLENGGFLRTLASWLHLAGLLPLYLAPMTSSSRFCLRAFFQKMGCCFGFLGFLGFSQSGSAAIVWDRSVPELAFAAREIEASLSAETAPTIRFDLTAGELGEEGFEIVPSNEEIVVRASAAAGAMYGGLELAEQLRLRGLGGVEATRCEAPYMPLRGIKFNLPLDVRTPSYSDACDAAQVNMPEVWSMDFWRETIDELARHRFNFISFWNLHPFPSLVKVPEYPEVALADVRRSTAQWKENYNLLGLDYDQPEIVDHYETLKVMTIEQKIEFWREVMRYAKERNVDIYFVTWNIFVNGTEGKYGITEDIGNPVTVDYFRKSIAAMYRAYPDLAGIGLTTGENMPGSSFEEREEWAFRTYGLGTLDAAQAEPQRKLTLIHRQHMAASDYIAQTFKPLFEQQNLEFVFSFKYAKAHVYSSTVQPYHTNFVEDIGSIKTLWTLRNDDTFYFRWGSPNFVRSFIENIPHEVSKGFYFGSDQWIWGREFLSKRPKEPTREIELSKHWYQWMLWGRLGYDPKLSDQRFAAVLGSRFPAVDGADLMTAWERASLVYPLTTGFHWGALDFQWYIEGCKSRPGPAETPTGFHDVNRFISLPPHPSVKALSIPEFVALAGDALSNGGKEPERLTGLAAFSGKATPFEVADEIEGNARRALALSGAMRSGGADDLRRVLGDIRIVSRLGLYYANKIRGATYLALFRETGGLQWKKKCGEALNAAAAEWRYYAAYALCDYKNPLWTNRVGYVDWLELLESVYYDLTIAGEPVAPSPMRTSPGGVILEAEGARFAAHVKVASKVEGYTGGGYLQAGEGIEDTYAVAWTYEAAKAGIYSLEARASSIRSAQLSGSLYVNGIEKFQLAFPRNSRPEDWVWARARVALKQGENQIELRLPVALLADHLNLCED